MANPTTHIAMWSGPRNISTAMMRSFDARTDTTVIDEPLYARYLNANPDQHHPARNEIIAKGPLKLNEITPSLTGQPPQGSTISYQKHMAHHLLPTDFNTPNHPGRLDWIDTLHNCLLIRDPADMITSFIKVIPNPTPTDLGLPQQVRLFNHLRDHLGNTPLVLDAKDVLQSPKKMLTALCNHVGIAFDQAMLSWNPGPRPTDGLWAPHWYKNVYKSTRFTPYQPKNEPVPTRLASVHDQCQTLYNKLHQHRLQPQ